MGNIHCKPNRLIVKVGKGKSIAQQLEESMKQARKAEQTAIANRKKRKKRK